MQPDDPRSKDQPSGERAQPQNAASAAVRTDHNPAAGKGAGAANPGEPGTTPGGHYENTDHGYGTGIKADAGDTPPSDPAYGGRRGEYDAGQRRNDKPDPVAPPAGSTPASDEERHGLHHGSASPGPQGGEGIFGSNAPFGGGPEPEGAGSASGQPKGSEPPQKK